MATRSDPAPSPAPAAAPSRFSPKLLVTIAGLVAALGLGGGLFFVLRGGQVHATPSAPEPAKPIFVALEPLTVNLQSEGKPKFLHLGVTLRVHDEKAQGRVAEALPELRSRLFLLLSNRDAAALSTAQDKAKLADEIKLELNRAPAANQPAYGVTGVAFNAFVVQ